MQNHTEKQFMPSKTTMNWLFNDICCLFIACFDWKIGFFQQTVVRVYYILNKQQKGKGLPSNFSRVARLAKVSDHLNLKIYPKEMLQRLPIALVQVKASNTSENFLNEIR